MVIPDHSKKRSGVIRSTGVRSSGSEELPRQRHRRLRPPKLAVVRTAAPSTLASSQRSLEVATEPAADPTERPPPPRAAVPRPPGYEPDELPDQPIPRRPVLSQIVRRTLSFAVEASVAVNAPPPAVPENSVEDPVEGSRARTPVRMTFGLKGMRPTIHHLGNGHGSQVSCPSSFGTRCPGVASYGRATQRPSRSPRNLSRSSACSSSWARMSSNSRRVVGSALPSHWMISV